MSEAAKSGLGRAKRLLDSVVVEGVDRRDVERIKVKSSLRIHFSQWDTKSVLSLRFLSDGLSSLSESKGLSQTRVERRTKARFRLRKKWRGSLDQ